MKDVYPLKALERILEKYDELIASVLKAAAKFKVKVLLGSKGVVTNSTRLLVGKAKFEALRKRCRQLFVNIHSNPQKFRTMFHPECITNPRCLTFIYKFICEQLNLVMTALLVYLISNEMAECTFGNNLYEHISGMDAFLFLVQARNDFDAKQQANARELGGRDTPSANLHGGTRGRTPRASQQAHAQEMGGRDTPSSAGELLEVVR